MNDTYRLLGGPGSPYSLKIRAILRYRRIPHLWMVPNGYLGSGGELRLAGKRVIPVMQFPDGSYWADSTPLAYTLEARHPGQRSLIPDDPGQAFLAHLIEDMADEMLVIAMFDLRWGSLQDQEFCAQRQLSGWMSPCPKEELDKRIAAFIARQTSGRAKWVQGESHDILMDFYSRILAVIEAMLDTSAYLFGARPSLADFGLYGQLSQCAIDPSASAIMRATAPRTFQWTQSLDDACGVEGEWAAPAAHNPAVSAMLQIAGEFYLPFLRAHAQAAAEKRNDFSVAIGARTWQGHPERYKLKCLIWLRRELSAMPAASREAIRPLLESHGCWDALQSDELDLHHVPPMAPM